MPVKLRDVADKAGVAVSTVSNVLNGYTKSGIKPATCEKVRKAAAELGYRPNAIARSLKVQRTNTIGFYTGYGFREARDSFRAEIYTGILNACDEYDFDFHIHANLEGKPPQEIQRRMCDGRVDGVVAYTGEDDPASACIVDSGLPCVAIADRHSRMPSVIGSDELGMQIMVKYLYDIGHRRMLFLEPDTFKDAIGRRVAAFLETTRELGVEASVDKHPWFESGKYLLELIQKPDRPTAICNFNDKAAYLLLRHARLNGIQVPHDFAVVGFDGLLAGDAATCDLVTIRVPWENMAVEAVRLLMSIIGGKQVPLLTYFPVELIKGDTV